jgi:hypothetical protein
MADVGPTVRRGRACVRASHPHHSARTASPQTTLSEMIGIPLRGGMVEAGSPPESFVNLYQIPMIRTRAPIGAHSCLMLDRSDHRAPLLGRAAAEEITADYNDMIYAASAPQSIHPKMAAQAPCRRRQPGGSPRPPLHLHPCAAKSGAASAPPMRCTRNYAGHSFGCQQRERPCAKCAKCFG